MNPPDCDVRMNADTRPTRILGELRRRVLGWMLLISIAPLTVMALQGYHCGMQAITETTHQHLLSVVQARSSLITAWLRQREAELDVLAASPSIARCCAHFAQLSDAEITAETSMLLRAVEKGLGTYDLLCVYDGGWNVVARSHASHEKEAVVIPAQIRAKIEAGETFVIESPHMNSGGTMGFYLAKAIANHSGERVGAIIADLNITRGLSSLVQERAGLGATGKTFILDKDNQILTEPLPGEAMVTRPYTREMTSALSAAERPSSIGEYTDYRDERVLYTTAYIPTVDWLLVLELDKREANAWLDTLARRAGETGLATLVALVIVALWISNRLGRPLAELARVAQRIRSGATEERLGPMSGAEAEEVRQAFNEMLDDLREKQQQLIRAATLAYVGQLTSSIVHEMRNPLSSIKMNIQALKRKVQEESTYSELAEIADSQVRRVETMLDELLQFGRPVELHREPTSFKELSVLALTVVKDTAAASSVLIRVEDHTGGVTTRLDREYVCRALTNLLTNAIQASPANSEVRLVGRVAGDKQRSVIEVYDCGVGISNDGRERLFLPFFTTKSNGVGLGLANAKKIVELHGGGISATNNAERGSVFTVTLPL